MQNVFSGGPALVGVPQFDNRDEIIEDIDEIIIMTSQRLFITTNNRDPEY
jgi:hypothetical protein